MSRNRSWLVVVAVIGILLGLVLTAFCGRVNSDYFEICSSPGREKGWDRIAENFPVFSLSSASHALWMAERRGSWKTISYGPAIRRGHDRLAARHS